MPVPPLLATASAMLALYAAFVLAPLLAGRRAEAGVAARFVPDCVLLLRRLLGDARVPGPRKAALVLVFAYLASPIDLIPDFVPIAGQLDDVLVLAFGLRFVLRGGGPDLIAEHWPGSPSGARLIARLAYGAESTGAR